MSLKAFALITVISTSSFAAEVKITSFRYTGQKTWTAELCGKVIREVPKMDAILITVDPRSNGAGKYIAWSAPTGEFCTTVTSYRGEANAELVDEPAVKTQSTATR